MKVLLSAYACDPTKGSEPGNGYNWAIGLANKGYEVHCLTRSIGKAGINSKHIPSNLHFHYIKLPLKLEALYGLSQATMYLHYVLWQWLAYQEACLLHKKISFDLAHHVTYGSIQMGSFLYKLKIPFIFGPTGGGQAAPKAYIKYFGSHWQSEIKREKVSELLQRVNPACKEMIKNAKVVLATNLETFALSKSLGAQRVELMLDAALPEDFFPSRAPIKELLSGELKLLWIGRFMPRKGITLVLEVMSQLKSHPNITLTVVGDGEMKDSFLELLDHYGLSTQVRWLGRVPHAEVKAIYATHDAFFFTSLRDSSPAQLVEAMAYGLPVITLDLHGQGILVDSSRGIKCWSDDPATTVTQLKEAILKLADDRKLLHQLSASAYKFSLEQTWEKKISTVIDRYYA